ncbi:MAG: hypothetical protein AB8B55_19495 [Mariniblastus sp.]
MIGKTRAVADDMEPEVRHLINKRLTLNILIQGAATHAFLTAHHSVRTEMNLLDTGLIPLYDKFNTCNNLAYWRGAIIIVAGRTMKFWKTLHRPTHPFYRHRFLRRHGRQLAIDAFNSAKNRCREKGLPLSGFQNEACMFHVFQKLSAKEIPHFGMLEVLGKKVCHQIFGIETEQLSASLTPTPAWGTVRRPKTWQGRLTLQLMVGWGGVDRHDDGLKVVAKAITWPLLIHELVKGTMELICLHGLNDLSNEDYVTVMDETEHLEYEIPMIQIGPEIFRRFLGVLPREIPLAQCVMKVANLEPIDLEEFLFEMIESPNRATDMLRSF